MYNEQQARVKFAKYFLHLKAAQKADGAPVPSKFEEWDMFVQHMIEEEEFPVEAKNWKCPKSLEKIA